MPSAWRDELEQSSPREAEKRSSHIRGLPRKASGCGAGQIFSEKKPSGGKEGRSESDQLYGGGSGSPEERTWTLTTRKRGGRGMGLLVLEGGEPRNPGENIWRSATFENDVACGLPSSQRGGLF